MNDAMPKLESFGYIFITDTLSGSILS